jgi:hypothetical protein
VPNVGGKGREFETPAGIVENERKKFSAAAPAEGVKLPTAAVEDETKGLPTNMPDAP